MLKSLRILWLVAAKVRNNMPQKKNFITCFTLIIIMCLATSVNFNVLEFNMPALFLCLYLGERYGDRGTISG